MPYVLAFSMLFLGGFFSCGGNTTLPALGAVPPASLCTDVKRCDVRGDRAVSTLKGTPIHLAEKQGPESYLGKVAPKRVANSVLKTCGSDIVRGDWLETGPSTRTVKLSESGKQQLRASLKTYLAQQLLAHPETLEGHDVSIDALIDAGAMGLVPQEVSLTSQTYWLTDAAFEKRVGQCGEEEYANIIYSLTLLQLSDLTRKELESKLYTNLSNKLLHSAAATAPELDSEQEIELDLEPVAHRGAEPETKPEDVMRTRLRELAFDTVRSLASELRTIAAFGFDEP